MTYDLLTPSAARLWTHSPDWAAAYDVTRSFRTDVIASRNNTEQRRALRDVPRLSAEYRTVVSGDDLRSANHFLRAWQNKPSVVPDFSRYATLASAASGGASTLTITSPPAWIAASQVIILCDGSDHVAVVVDSVTSDTVTLSAPLASAWGSGTIVRPGLFGLLNGSTRASRFHRGASEIDVRLDVYPGGEPPEAEGAASATFNGYEVFTAEPDWSGGPSLNHLWPVEGIDYGIGRTAQFRPIDRQESLAEAEFACTRSQAVAIEQVFLRAKGRRGAFYRSTGHKDFDLATTASSGSSSLVASGSEIVDDFGSIDYAANETAIEVIKTDGTRLQRLITGITASGANSAVAVNSAWPSDLTTTNVARISWLPLVRFASDSLTTSWRTPLSAKIRTSFQTVKV